MAYGYTNNSLVPQTNMQSLFPQPQGNVYITNSVLEAANIPTGAGLSVAICPPENIMYIKTMQNGSPLFYSYNMTPISGESKTEQKSENQQSISYDQIAAQLKSQAERIQVLEKKLEEAFKPNNNKKGSDWEL